jgi:hypothetical protein
MRATNNTVLAAGGSAGGVIVLARSVGTGFLEVKFGDVEEVARGRGQRIEGLFEGGLPLGNMLRPARGESGGSGKGGPLSCTTRTDEGGRMECT